MAEEDQKEVEEGAEGEGGEAQAKGGSKKLLIIIILAVVLIGGAGAAAFFFLPSGDEVVAEEGAEEGHGAPEHGEEAAHGEVDAHGNPVSGIQAYFFEVPEILVNLSSSGAGNRYLKMKLNLELGSEADLVTVERLMPRIVNDFQLYLRQLRVEDLQGAAGVYRLREALLLRANQAAQPLQINDVLFREILVQ